MKCLIAYFSATGNTKKCAELYYKYLTDKLIDCKLYNIEDRNLDKDYEYDTLFICYPIHGFNAPLIVNQFAKSLERRKEKTRLIILKTSGEPLRINNISSYSLRRILKRRNYYLTNEYHYVMPYDIIFRHTDLMAYNMYEVMKKLIPLDCEDILNNKVVKLKYMPFGHILQLIMLIEHPGAKINGWFMKTNKNCVSCGKCERICPVKNITIKDGKVKFHSHCMMCTRCVFECPKDAIKLGLFNSWKVNGEYHFNKPDYPEVNKHKRYCKRAYKKYFENAEMRINHDKSR